MTNNTNFDQEKFDILRLARSNGITINKIHKYLEIYDNCSEIIKNIDKINNKIVLASEDSIKKEIEETEEIGAQIITYKDECYPELLNQLDSFPIVLTCRGNINLLSNEKKIAVIGSRSCSINSFNFSKAIIKEVSNYGYIIVSGLARGIDSSAHIGSIENGTIAVLGSGIDVIYPKENEYLYYEILSNNSLIISEFSLHSKPKPENFIMRNRIIAGLSRGVLVVEAGISSGTMHTVKQALKLGREIMVFPGSPYDERCSGSNKLLQDGATMVIDTKDIIECVENFMPDNCFKDNHFYYNCNLKENNENIEDNEFKKYYKDELCQINNISITEQILSKLDYTPISIDELIDNLPLDLNTINSELIKLQLNNKIIIDNGRINLKLNM